VPIVSAASNDEVIGEGDAQFFRASLEPPGENAVLSAGSAISGGMVMPDQDRRGAVSKGLPEDLPWSDDRTIIGPLAENKIGDDASFSVQADQTEAFDCKPSSLGKDIGRRHPRAQNASVVLTGRASLHLQKAEDPSTICSAKP
jgi:hypothetical protein